MMYVYYDTFPPHSNPFHNYMHLHDRLISLGLLRRGTESARSATYLYEHLSDPSTASSGDPAQSAFNKASHTDLTLWETFELPGHERQLKCVGLAMTLGAEIDPIDRLFSCTSPTPLTYRIVGGGVFICLFDLIC